MGHSFGHLQSGLPHKYRLNLLATKIETGQDEHHFLFYGGEYAKAHVNPYHNNKLQGPLHVYTPDASQFVLGIDTPSLVLTYNYTSTKTKDGITLSQKVMAQDFEV